MINPPKIIGAKTDNKQSIIPMTDFAILCDLMIAIMPQITPIGANKYVK